MNTKYIYIYIYIILICFSHMLFFFFFSSCMDLHGFSTNEKKKWKCDANAHCKMEMRWMSFVKRMGQD